MKILFKFPTRGRPEKFRNVLEKYYSMMSNQYEYEFIITLDNDDVSMNNPAMRKYMDSKPNLQYFFSGPKTKIEAVNADMEGVEFDILVLVSDDMTPVVNFYDVEIVQQMEKHFPSMDGALHFNDGKFGQDRTITLSIMGKKLYDYFGYIYHPDYKSFRCDNEFTEVVEKLGKRVYVPKVIIRHDWGGDRSDAIYAKNYVHAKYDEGIYHNRKAKGFPK